MTRRGATPARTVAGVRLTHPDRVLYPAQGITKAALATYYAAVAARLLPQVAHRPLSLVRCPAGESGACFFQKHFGADLPAGLRGVPIAEKAAQATYGMVEDLGGLVSLVQIGVLEIHPWGATIDRLEQPDRLIFDLDPDPSLPWERVTGAALELRALLAELDLQGFAKITGGKGLHVVVPIEPRHGWDTVKAVAHAVAERLAARAPDRYTTALPKKDRAGRIFIDYLRNGRGQTAVAPYSPRARSGAPVAAPVAWAEVEAGLRSDAFTVATMPGRLAAQAEDPWAAMADLRQPLTATLLRALGI